MCQEQSPGGGATVEATGSLTCHPPWAGRKASCGWNWAQFWRGGSGSTCSRRTKFLPIRNLPEPWSLEILKAVPGPGI